MDDFRYAIRQFRKNPGTTALAVLILALCIGGNTAVFSVVDKALLHPVPFPSANRLIVLNEIDTRHEATWSVSPPLIHELSEQTNYFESVAAYFQGPAELAFGQQGAAAKLSGANVTPNFFDTLGARPLMGRTFSAGEGTPGNDKSLVVSYGLWQQRLDGDANAIGRTIQVGGDSYTVIGVMPSAFEFPFSTGHNQFWTPHAFTVETTTGSDWRRDRTWATVAKLKPGISLVQAQAFLDASAARQQQDHPDPNANWTIAAAPIQSLFVGPSLRETLWSLQTAIGMVLFIACANVGTLLLARVIARRGEFGVRLAVGAGRLRIARQLVIEGLCLAAVSAAAGIFFAWGGIHALDRFYLEALPRLRPLELDLSVLAVTAFAAALAGFLFTLGPAWLVSRLDLTLCLKDSAPQHGDNKLNGWFRDGLLVMQVALAIVLVIGASLMTQTVVQLLRVDPGLDPHGLYRVLFDQAPLKQLVQVDSEAVKQGGESRKRAISAWWPKMVQAGIQSDEAIVAALRSLPGVDDACVSVSSGGGRAFADYRVEGGAERIQLNPNLIGVRSGNYFKTQRMPLLSGRYLTVEDAVPGQEAVNINQELARLCWPGENPLGKRFSALDDSKDRYVVVGVIKDIRDWKRELPPGPTVYIPFERITAFSPTRGGFMVRSSMPSDPLRKAISSLAKAQAPAREMLVLESIETNLYTSTAPRRIYMWLINTLGALGLLLSALGVYSVMAYAAERRTREIGIRMALGATRGNIAAMILSHAGRLIANGAALGLATAFGLARYIEGLLYGVAPGDPRVYAGAILILGAVAAMACFLPARRASCVEPSVALRTD